ncbi:hypothetical protein MKX01_030882 [Papaver californicum]|nr:hypothetical protein MKX01_030882 [Papaver californicum]
MYHCEIDCCNGLSLCEGACGSRYVVVNVATRQRFSIPEPLKHPGWNFAAIVFDPIQSNPIHYKIVRPNPYSDIPSLDIFSSEIGKWVRHEVPGDWVEHLCISEFDSPCFGGLNRLRGMYMDGMLYILTRGKLFVRFDLKSLAVSAEVIKVPCGANGHGLIGHSRGILNDTARDAKSAHISGDFYWNEVSGHDTVDQPGNDYKIDDSRIL